MGVRLKRQRDGSLREHWYGEYEDNGKRTEINLNVLWKGTPPGSVLHPGMDDQTPSDKDFERSRDRAEAALARHVEELRHKGRADHLTERLIESKTGRAVEYARIEDLPTRWRTLGREKPAGERYLAACDAVFNRFAAFMRKENPSAACLYEVTPEDAAAFVTDTQAGLSRKTARDTVKLLNKAFARFLPVGAANPFAAFVGRRANGENGTVHRKPFTPEELKAVLDAARDDDFMCPLITAAACTGMRRGDVCGLRWSAVDLAGGMLAVKTSKTEAEVEIPIFLPLLSVLKDRKGAGGEYVFPEAAQMLAENPDGLTWRFKKIVARALEGTASRPGLTQGQRTLPPAIPVADIEAAGVKAIAERVPAGERRDRRLDVFRRYCAGASVRQIVAATGYCKATVSNDLHAVQDMIGKPFLRVETTSVRAAVRRVTQTEREQGQRAASVRDWHALRATWVTLALAAGVPVELVRRVTGHATVETVLKHYFRPDREQFRAALASAMPGVLTGGTVQRLKVKPADELAALAGKVAAGAATEDDKARLRRLATEI
jgi:integrase